MKKILRMALMLLLVGGITFVAVGFFNPVLSFESKVTVNAPVQRTFFSFNSTKDMKHWMTGFKSHEYVSGIPGMPDSKYVITFEEGEKTYKFNQTFKDWQFCKNVEFVFENDRMKNEMKVLFSDRDGQTEITSQSKVKGKNILWRSLLYFMRGRMEGRMQNDLFSFKNYIEESVKN